MNKLELKEAVIFCKTCGSFMERQQDGLLRCRSGHILSDDRTITIQKSRVARLEKEKEERRKILLTFPDPDNGDVFVFELINPFRDKQKDGLKGNASSFKVYEEISRLKIRYNPKEFKYIPGNIFGEKGEKPGIIICVKDIAGYVKKCVEEIELPEGHYELRQIIFTDTTPRELIERLKSEINLE